MKGREANQSDLDVQSGWNFVCLSSFFNKTLQTPVLRLKTAVFVAVVEFYECFLIQLIQKCLFFACVSSWNYSVLMNLSV